MRTYTYRLIAILCLLFANYNLLSAASLYQTIDEDGTIHYTNSPPASSNTPQTIQKKEQWELKNLSAKKWKFGEARNEMRGTVNKYAFNKSKNTVNFDFPYQGNQHGTLVIYDDNLVLFYIERGQLVCHGSYEYGTCLVLVKFDDGEAKYISAKTSGDDSTTIRLQDAEFLDNIKISKKVMIQVDVYRNGLPIFTFDLI